MAAIWCRKKVVAFCREMPDVCDAKRPLTILGTLESVADGKFQARCDLRLVSGFDQFLSLSAGAAFSAITHIRTAEDA